LDMSQRYEHALAMAEALRAGARGIEPPSSGVADAATAATRVVAPGEDATEATRALPPREARAPRRPREPRRGRAAPATEAQPARAQRRPSERPRRRRGGIGRALGRVFIVLLVLLAVAAGVVVAADQLGGNPQLRKVTAKDVNGAVDEIKQLID